MTVIIGCIAFPLNIPFCLFKLFPSYSKCQKPLLVATPNVSLLPDYPSKTGSEPHLSVPNNFPEAASNTYTFESLCLSVQKKYFPFLENLIDETALVFLPKFARANIYILSESQTNIKGFAPKDPVTTNFLSGLNPNDMISSV